jgi:glycosyltransferase involved in cell wall biosynthesis
VEVVNKETVTACFLVLDPPIDRFALLVEYIRPYIDEIVVVIDDRTDPIIIQKIESWEPIKTVMYKWNNDFAEARNAALPHVTSEWVLHLDPDELPSVLMMGHIQWVKEGNCGPATLGWLYWTTNFWDGLRGEEKEYHWHCRLFRTAHGKWVRPVHEIVSLDGYAEPRGTYTLPNAPRDAKLIHSKPGKAIAEADALYAELGEVSR